MTGPQAYSRLTCSSCTSQVFLKKFYLATKHGSGTHEEFAGWVCRQCNADVDLAKMIEHQELEHKRAELKALEQEVAQRSVPASSTKVSDRATVSLKEG